MAQATLHTDAAAAFQNALQLSGGRMRYLHLAQTFVKRAVKAKLIKLKKVKGVDNIADIFTKHVDGPTLCKHWAATGVREATPDELAKRPMELTPINRIEDIVDADPLVQAYEVAQREKVMDEGLQLAWRMRKGI